jgi:cbb3-type cytochrome oxidase subunit 3
MDIAIFCVYAIVAITLVLVGVLISEYRRYRRQDTASTRKSIAQIVQDELDRKKR